MKLSILSLLAILFISSHAFAGNSLERTLSEAAPDVNPEVISLAVAAMKCAEANGVSPSDRLAVIDYSLPSTERRLWIFDLLKARLLFRELVAHGRTSGENLAEFFSNEPGSLASSLGLFRTLETYQGKHGYSLRIDGLEPGFNDRAFDRAIVIHGAPYVNDSFADRQGRIGRSWGCPAVRSGVARKIIDSLKGGQFVFSYYPDRKWLSDSRLLNCRQSVASVHR
jgi:L,D-transpeptidase catalytic domain